MGIERAEAFLLQSLHQAGMGLRRIIAEASRLRRQVLNGGYGAEGSGQLTEGIDGLK